MKQTLKKNLLLVWLSLTLTILFFHPLIATLHDNDIILQWRRQNTYELLAAIALMTAILIVLLFCVERYLNRYFKLGVYFSISAIPMISFGTHFLYQLGYKGELIALGQYAGMHKMAFLSAGLFAAALLIVAAIKYPSRFTHVILMLLIMLSPINFSAGWTIWKLREENATIYLKKNVRQPQSNEKALHNPVRNIVIFLFDEMSYEYLYKNREIDPRYRNIKYLSSISANYHAAVSPGNETITALPGLLVGVRYENISMENDSIYCITKKYKKELLKVDNDNLFSAAKQKGLKTSMVGPYLPYCEMYGPFLDECRSFSIYNYATLEEESSLLNPFLTTFIIWPRQYPQGFIKNKVVSEWQKKRTGKTIRFTMKVLDQPEPFLLFAHFYVTHVPFVFNKDGFYRNEEPFLQNSENYRRSLDYADRILGDFFARLKKNGKFEDSMIVVLADHNYRIMFPDNRNAIPLLIKGIRQNHRLDIDKPVRAELLLRAVVSNLKLN